ncbi:CPBP family intramembrane glutamic endopeptidase [Lysobacter silvisoli]|uniref:CPBP family intramembrane metalloprotease n=1 Tax=Lysobacter silvisoli TaxID=2293254 RepID=A0A371K003_9GAMM|nr:type II CAAX endopeptidase family protein [Lysobacter silvisoli]RDZ27248.1 CPBP family intramembrane metalloprotease [Lysobacter silvisoli]
MNPPTPSSTQVRTPAPWAIALLALGAFAWLDGFHLDLFRQLAAERQWQGGARLWALTVIGYGPQFVVVLGLARLLFGPGQTLYSLGLAPDRWRIGLLAAVACTAILPLGYALIAPLSLTPQFGSAVLRQALLSGVGEELLYRAFLFGLLFRYAGWGFLPAALVSALYFGANHLYQGQGLADSAAIFALTALGGLWFSWLYVEWRWNLWLPIGLHVLMNLYWDLFAVSDTALGPMAANLLRFAVIGLSLALTLRYARRRGGRLIVGRHWWWGGPARPD